ncbi:MAG TPA: heme exporter protein CcmD [Acidimicrobiales bacterium]|nr:heme exporter protein CcmD [Acidimicrobiales bacterium]
MSYVWMGYAVTAVGLALYAVRTVRRGRQLARSFPPEEHGW